MSAGPMRSVKLLFSLVICVIFAGCIGVASNESNVQLTDGTIYIPATVELLYLDNTLYANSSYDVYIAGAVDHGVLMVNNTVPGTGNYALKVSSKPPDWTITLDTDKVTVGDDEMKCVIITYEVGSDAEVGNNYLVNVTVWEIGNETNNDTVTLRCNIAKQDGINSKKGDRVVVDYSVTDEEGNELDSGKWTVISGDDPNTIEGFYMGVLGMELPRSAGSMYGETKQIRVPPELAYGVDSGHQLENEVLIFTLTMRGST